MLSQRDSRRIVPEVVQTSATDCGPACMKAVLAGMGLDLSYRALREACQTDVDGSSVDTLEELAGKLGLDAEQIMLPLEHVFLPEAKALPAIIVTLTAGGRPHFVVLWSRVGRWVQVMDPASRRHWTSVKSLVARLYQHTTVVPASAWREWAGSDEARAGFRRRLLDLGVADASALVAEAAADRQHESLAALDAATRALEALVSAGAVRRGPTAAALARSMLARQAAGRSAIPDGYWSVRPSPETSAEPQLVLRGAVLLRFRGWRSDAPTTADAPAALGAELAHALASPLPSPARALLGALAQDSTSIVWLIAAGIVLATAGRILQAIMLRAVLDLGRDLATVQQRALGLLAIGVVAMLLLGLQVPLSLGLLGIGRRLEVRMRKAYFEKLPQTEDRYFQSRLASDMASRCHAIQSMRGLPSLVAQGIAIALELVTTVGALCWIAPGQWHIAVGLGVLCLGLPLLAQALFFEPDMRVQTHAGASSSFVLNALVGLTPIRIHGAERALRRGQEALLVEWTRARQALQALSVSFEALLSGASYGLVVLLVWSHLHHSTGVSSVLLLVFWALRFPILGQRLLVLTRSVPSAMNRVRRLLELIGTVEAPTADAPTVEASTSEAPAAEAPTDAAPGVAISIERVRVKGGGHLILDGVSLDIGAGEHVAIVGPSGAGKSTLVGLLLGWLRPCRGRIMVDGRALDQAAVERLRRETAWVDPSIQLWNESLLDNLRFGNDSSRGWALERALEGADLLDLLEALPDGLQTALGEGGGLVSGGQGQRVRLGRAMLRAQARLVVLDEPFRGLDRERRARLLRASRQLWAKATLLCVTHDVLETRDFDRVVVIEGGRVAEAGPPAELLAAVGSRYAQLARADADNRRLLWRCGTWRRWWLSDGVLQERAEA